jgi:hypothetical protein
MPGDFAFTAVQVGRSPNRPRRSSALGCGGGREHRHARSLQVHRLHRRQLAALDPSLPVVESLHLPLGISFYTFHALSYVIDIYRGKAPAQRSLLRHAIYISLFPQLVADPIVRYREISISSSTKR